MTSLPVVERQFRLHFPMWIARKATQNRRQCRRIKIAHHHRRRRRPSICSSIAHSAHTSYNVQYKWRPYHTTENCFLHFTLCIPPNFVHLLHDDDNVCRRRTLIVIIIIAGLWMCACDYFTHTTKHCQPFLCQQRATYNYYRSSVRAHAHRERDKVWWCWWFSAHTSYGRIPFHFYSYSTAWLPFIVLSVRLRSFVFRHVLMCATDERCNNNNVVVQRIVNVHTKTLVEKNIISWFDGVVEVSLAIYRRAVCATAILIHDDEDRAALKSEQRAPRPNRTNERMNE